MAPPTTLRVRRLFNNTYDSVVQRDRLADIADGRAVYADERPGEIPGLDEIVALDVLGRVSRSPKLPGGPRLNLIRPFGPAASTTDSRSRPGVCTASPRLPADWTGR
jgi:hypothetical protein